MIDFDEFCSLFNDLSKVDVLEIDGEANIES